MLKTIFAQEHFSLTKLVLTNELVLKFKFYMTFVLKEIDYALIHF